MKIKRFVAPDMRTVLRMVREEQGPDAVILSNRPVEGGVEVVAATDYDEKLAQDALRSLLPQKPATALDQARDAMRWRALQLVGVLRHGRGVHDPGVDVFVGHGVAHPLAQASVAPSADTGFRARRGSGR